MQKTVSIQHNRSDNSLGRLPSDSIPVPEAAARDLRPVQLHTATAHLPAHAAAGLERRQLVVSATRTFALLAQSELQQWPFASTWHWRRTLRFLASQTHLLTQ